MARLGRIVLGERLDLAASTAAALPGAEAQGAIAGVCGAAKVEASMSLALALLLDGSGVLQLANAPNASSCPATMLHVLLDWCIGNGGGWGSHSRSNLRCDIPTHHQKRPSYG